MLELLCRRRRWLVLFLQGALLLTLQAQQITNKTASNDPPKEAALIFSGTVVTVEHVPAATENGIGTVRVTFRVREGVRGVGSGEQFTIAEWDGLWRFGERYRVGQPVTLFLHAPSSELGLTSPVNAAEGRVGMSENPHPVTPKAGATRVGQPAGKEKRRLREQDRVRIGAKEWR